MPTKINCFKRGSLVTSAPGPWAFDDLPLVSPVLKKAPPTHPGCLIQCSLQNTFQSKVLKDLRKFIKCNPFYW